MKETAHNLKLLKILENGADVVKTHVLTAMK